MSFARLENGPGRPREIHAGLKAKNARPALYLALSLAALTAAQRKSTKDILANKQAGKVSMVVGWQDSFALEEENGNEWRFARPPQTKLREYYELGLRTANLTYQLSNQFGGGMLDPEARLTTQGKYIVGKMQDLGILVDVCGHNGEQTNLDIIAMARRPVAITHGCCKALNDNPRNSSDRVIEAMAKTGGLMAVAALDASSPGEEFVELQRVGSVKFSEERPKSDSVRLVMSGVGRQKQGVINASWAVPRSGAFWRYRVWLFARAGR